jgi:hypothetical protein
MISIYKLAKAYKLGDENLEQFEDCYEKEQFLNFIEKLKTERRNVQKTLEDMLTHSPKELPLDEISDLKTKLDNASTDIERKAILYTMVSCDNEMDPEYFRKYKNLLIELREEKEF